MRAPGADIRHPGNTVPALEGNEAIQRPQTEKRFFSEVPRQHCDGRVSSSWQSWISAFAGMTVGATRQGAGLQPDYNGGKERCRGAGLLVFLLVHHGIVGGTPGNFRVVHHQVEQ